MTKQAIEFIIVVGALLVLVAVGAHVANEMGPALASMVKKP